MRGPEPVALQHSGPLLPTEMNESETEKKKKTKENTERETEQVAVMIHEGLHATHQSDNSGLCHGYLPNGEFELCLCDNFATMQKHS